MVSVRLILLIRPTQTILQVQHHSFSNSFSIMVAVKCYANAKENIFSLMPKDEVKLLISFVVAERDSIATNYRPCFSKALGIAPCTSSYS